MPVPAIPCTARLSPCKTLLVATSLLIGFKTAVKAIKSVLDFVMILVGLALITGGLGIMFTAGDPGYFSYLTVSILTFGVIIIAMGSCLGCCLNHPGARCGGTARCLKPFGILIYIALFVSLVAFAIGSLVLAADIEGKVIADSNILTTLCDSECQDKLAGFYLSTNQVSKAVRRHGHTAKQSPAWC